MELVPDSQQLRAAWPSLSILGELKVILTMRLYLRQLRRVQHTSSSFNNLPGPLGPKPLPCTGLQFGFDPKGPFPTIGAFMNISREHKFALYRSSMSRTLSLNWIPLYASAFTPLIFTHNMRNLLLDDHHMLWVVDWGFSGLVWISWDELCLTDGQWSVELALPALWILVYNCNKYMAEPAFEIGRVDEKD